MNQLPNSMLTNQFFLMGRGFSTHPAKLGSGTSGSSSLEVGLKIVKAHLQPKQRFMFDLGLFDGAGYTEVIRNDATEIILRRGTGQDMKTVKKPQ